MNARWAAGLAWALSDDFERRAPQVFYHLVAVLGYPDSSGMAIVYEHLRPAGVRVQRRGYSAYVISVAHREQRQDAYGGVLNGMESARQVQLLRLNEVQGVPGRAEPERRGLKLLLGKLDVLVAQHLVGVVLDPLEAEHLCRDHDLSEEHLHSSCLALRVRVKYARFGVVARLRVVGHVGAGDVGCMRLHVQLGHEVGLALVQVDRTGVKLHERGRLGDRFEDGPGVGVHQRVERPGRGAHVDTLGRVGHLWHEVPASVPDVNVVVFDQLVGVPEQLWTEELGVVHRQRSLVRRAEQVWLHDVRVGG